MSLFLSKIEPFIGHPSHQDMIRLEINSSSTSKVNIITRQFYRQRTLCLQNDNGHVTMITRKMSPTVYEVECLPVVDKLTIFAIGLSEIVGPYFDPWMGEYYE